MATANRHRGNIEQHGWLSALQEAQKEIAPVVPPGFYTTEEIAKKIGKSVVTTGRMIRELLCAKRLEVKTIKRPISSGVYKPVRHFRLKKGKFA